MALPVSVPERRTGSHPLSAIPAEIYLSILAQYKTFTHERQTSVLGPLAQTCRFLRHACIPMILSRVVFTGDEKEDSSRWVVPLVDALERGKTVSLVEEIREIHVHNVDLRTCDEDAPLLRFTRVLPKLAELTKLRVLSLCKTSFTPDLFNWLSRDILTLPTLKELALVSCTFPKPGSLSVPIHTADVDSLAPPSLQILSIEQIYIPTSSPYFKPTIVLLKRCIPSLHTLTLTDFDLARPLLRTTTLLPNLTALSLSLDMSRSNADLFASFLQHACHSLRSLEIPAIEQPVEATMRGDCPFLGCRLENLDKLTAPPWLVQEILPYDLQRVGEERVCRPKTIRFRGAHSLYEEDPTSPSDSASNSDDDDEEEVGRTQVQEFDDDDMDFDFLATIDAHIRAGVELLEVPLACFEARLAELYPALQTLVLRTGGWDLKQVVDAMKDAQSDPTMRLPAGTGAWTALTCIALAPYTNPHPHSPQDDLRHIPALVAMFPDSGISEVRIDSGGEEEWRFVHGEGEGGEWKFVVGEEVDE